MTTKKYGGGKRALAGVAVGGLIVAGVGFAAAAPASADDFSPMNAAPTATIDSLALTIQPDQDSSSATAGSATLGVYTISSTIGDLNSLEDLTTVSLCLSKDGEGDATCADANQDPKDTVLLEWSKATDIYTIDAATGGADTTSLYSLGNGSDVAPDYTEASTNTANYSYSGYAAAAVSMSPTWTFRASEAMREGAWTATLTANDGELSTAIAQALTVNWYGSVDVARVAQSYGDIAADSSAVADGISAGTIVVNGGADITYSMGAAFTDGSVTTTIDGGAFGSAVTTDRAVGFDCDPNETYNSGNSGVRLGLVAADCELAVQTSGTAEGGVTSETQSTSVYNGGGNPRLGSAYSSTVTVGVTADAS